MFETSFEYAEKAKNNLMGGCQTALFSGARGSACGVVVVSDAIGLIEQWRYKVCQSECIKVKAFRSIIFD